MQVLLSLLVIGTVSYHLSEYTRRTKAVDDANIVQFDEEKGIVDNYLYNAFRSEDGNSHTTEISDFWNEEDPQDYKYTESYY